MYRPSVHFFFLASLTLGLTAVSQADHIGSANVQNLGLYTNFSTAWNVLPQFFAYEGQIQHTNIQSPQSYSAGAASVHESAIGVTLDTGSVTSTGSTNVGLHLNNLTQTDFTVNNLSFAMSGISFTADSISSHAQMQGNLGSITGSTSLDLTNAVFTINGKAISLPTSISRTAPGSDVVQFYSEPGLTFDYYDQIVQHTSGGQTTYGAVTGLEFFFTNYKLQDGTLAYGTIQLGRVDADLRDSVPEPTCFFGFATMAGGFFLKRRRRS